MITPADNTCLPAPAVITHSPSSSSYGVGAVNAKCKGYCKSTIFRVRLNFVNSVFRKHFDMFILEKGPIITKKMGRTWNFVAAELSWFTVNVRNWVKNKNFIWKICNPPGGQEKLGWENSSDPKSHWTSPTSSRRKDCWSEMVCFLYIGSTAPLPVPSNLSRLFCLFSYDYTKSQKKRNFAPWIFIGAQGHDHVTRGHEKSAYGFSNGVFGKLL